MSAPKIMGLYRLAIELREIKQAMFWRRELVAYLIDRDGDRCGICAKRVDPDIRSGPRGSDMGPSIDHVIPRSRGGEDELENLRLTHWGCNRKRGNRGGNEQLRLVG